MKLYEHQAKAVFAQANIPTPKGAVIRSMDELETAALPAYPLVVKAQVPVGGRGKAGGIRFAADQAELAAVVGALLGSDLKGYPVNSLLVEETIRATQELYLAVTLDRASRRPMLIFSQSGGVDIEETARTDPQAVAKVAVDPAMGLHDFHLERLLSEGGVTDGELKDRIKDVARALLGLYLEKDALLAEINPLMVREDKTLVAADGKMEIDDSALRRQPQIAQLAGEFPADGPEERAAAEGLVYIGVDEQGSIGVISNGAGMIMSSMDAIAREGGLVANALDLGGGVNSEQVARAIGIVAGHTGLKALLINIFGGICRCDEVAGGVALLLADEGFRIPIVIRLEGTNKERGLEILSPLDPKRVIIVSSLAEGAAAVVRV